VRWLETRKIPVLFAVATLLPIAALCWLGVRTLDQDRDAERQRRRERLEVAAGRVALDIEQDLQRVEARLAEGSGIRFLPSGIVVADGEPLVFRPDVSSVSVLSSAQLVAAARLEERHPAAAITAYQHVAARFDSDRGEALVALGALFRRQRRFDEALRVYDGLAQLGALPVAGGQPAALVAIQGRAKIFLESGDKARLRDEALSFGRALSSGGWLIDRASFALYQHEMVKPWGGPAADAIAVQRAEGVSKLWRSWRQGELAARGRWFIGDRDMSTLAVWIAGSAGPVAAVLTPTQLNARWRRTWEERGLIVAITRTDGERVFGSVVDEVELSASDTRLPFVLAAATASSTPAGENMVRRRVVVGGVALACVLMVAASHGIYRITTRELLLARQQSDFVAAVSHEFRTPLTSMRHLLDLLVTRGVTDESRKAEYYGLLSGETDRLQRMVETLLAFGRIDAAAQVWKLEPLSVSELIRSVTDSFAREIRARSLVTELDPDLPTVRGDRDALERAIWNLLENAAKYSPGERPIRLFARREGATVVIGVQDHGIGIPVSEQQRVFQKFVRGDEARRTGIRGVGVGLALVKRIAEAHGGRIQLISRVGAGSTFTLVLPVAG
jgi:signal transduction histidine kinase